MTSPGYNDVEEQFIESSETHFVQVEESFADYVSSSDDHFINLDQNVDEIRNTIQDMANVTVFSAYKDEGAVIYSGNYVGGYNKIFADYGNSFDTSSGIFTAPNTGCFEFSAATHYYSPENRKFSYAESK